jgi:hypothetical protein
MAVARGLRPGGPPGGTDVGCRRRQFTTSFLDAATEFDEGIEWLRGVLEDEEETATLLDEAFQDRLRDKALSGARRRTGRTSFPTVVRVIAQVVTGQFHGLELEDGRKDREEALVDKAFGLDEARTVAVLDGSPWLTGTNEEMLLELSGLVAQRSLSGQAFEAKYSGA